jgi:hypothetical protein
VYKRQRNGDGTSDIRHYFSILDEKECRGQRPTYNLCLNGRECPTVTALAGSLGLRDIWPSSGLSRTESGRESNLTVEAHHHPSLRRQEHSLAETNNHGTRRPSSQNPSERVALGISAGKRHFSQIHRKRKQAGLALTLDV